MISALIIIYLYLFGMYLVYELPLDPEREEGPELGIFGALILLTWPISIPTLVVGILVMG